MIAASIVYQGLFYSKTLHYAKVAIQNELRVMIVCENEDCLWIHNKNIWKGKTFPVFQIEKWSKISQYRWF